MFIIVYLFKVSKPHGESKSVDASMPFSVIFCRCTTAHNALLNAEKIIGILNLSA